MADISLGVLVGALVFLIVLSAFFSAAEIGLMTLNRYRLRHLEKSGHRGARLASRLLDRPDRLLGLILLGNNFANITASSVATLLALELYGEKGHRHRRRSADLRDFGVRRGRTQDAGGAQPRACRLPAAYVLAPLLRVLYPLVWLTNILANLFLRAFGVSVHRQRSHEVTAEELRALVREANVLIPASHQDMLLAILDLEKVTVDEVMVPRNRIEGVDLDADWGDIVRQLTGGRYTRLPAYRGSLDNVIGIVHVRRVLNLMHENRLDRAAFDQLVVEPYFIPAGTPLNTQLLNFKQVKRRLGLVVDEYGDIQGLVTLDMILEEIVGDFTTRARPDRGRASGAGRRLPGARQREPARSQSSTRLGIAD